MNDMIMPLVDNLDLERLTEGERIWLWRRRQENTTGRSRGRGGNRMSSNEAAALLQLPLHVYSAAENENARDHREASRVVSDAIRALGGALRVKPSPGEQCALARRRSSIEVAELCQRLGGISKPTFFSREANGDPELLDLWRARGYSF